MLNKKNRIRILWVIVCIGGAILLQRFCHKQTDGFSIYKISSDLDFHEEWKVPPLSPDDSNQLSSILDQPYFYLAKGAQSYVFVSQDGHYVIKFFRIYHLQPPFWITHLNWPWILQPYQIAKIEQKAQELSKDFNSYKIAYDHLKDETGLIYLHLNKTDTLCKKLTLYDKINVLHTVDLDRMEFLVQKKATLAYPALAQLAEQQGLASAKRALTQLIDLLMIRTQKGISDKDPDLNTNFGFINETPLQIDVGRYRKDLAHPDGYTDRNEIIRITDNLSQWLRAYYPELAIHLEQLIQEIPLL